MQHWNLKSKLVLLALKMKSATNAVLVCFMGTTRNVSHVVEKRLTDKKKGAHIWIVRLTGHDVNTELLISFVQRQFWTIRLFPQKCCQKREWDQRLYCSIEGEKCKVRYLYFILTCWMFGGLQTSKTGVKLWLDKHCFGEGFSKWLIWG